MLCGSSIEIWNLTNHMKKWNKEHQTLSFQFFINKSSILMLFVLFFQVVCKISNFIMWTAKHLAQASCTELTLKLPHSLDLGLVLKICRCNLWKPKVPEFLLREIASAKAQSSQTIYGEILKCKMILFRLCEFDNMKICIHIPF